MRWWIPVLLLAGVARAADPLAPTWESLGGPDACPAEVYGRYVEALALQRARLDADPALPLAWERAIALLERFGRALELEGPLKAQLDRTDLAPERRPVLRGLYGHLLLDKARREGAGVVRFVFGPGGGRQDPDLPPAARTALTQAIEHLRAALSDAPRSIALRTDLAAALELLDEERHRAEIEKLRNEAAALAMRAERPRPEPPGHAAAAAALRGRAEELEQAEPPDHAAALLLRREALVRDFCAHTIPFEYEPTLFGPVSLLADADTIARGLTRTFVKRDGTLGTVAPLHYPPPRKQRVAIVEELARDRGAAATAILLAVAARGDQDEEVARAALEALVRQRPPSLEAHLPGLLARELFSGGAPRRVLDVLGGAQLVDFEISLGSFPADGEARLVELARRAEVRSCAPALAELLPLDDDLDAPRWVAAALGALGGPEQADALLAVAADPARPPFFRREAVLALGRVAPGRLDAVPAEPHLELARAAARHRAAPSDATLGRILAGLAREHEIDDAARLCAALDLRAAIPALEELLATHRDHYAAGAIRAAHAALAGGAD